MTKRVRDGIIAAGVTAGKFRFIPFRKRQRPTAMLDHNLAYLSLVETLLGIH